MNFEKIVSWHDLFLWVVSFMATAMVISSIDILCYVLDGVYSGYRNIVVMCHVSSIFQKGWEAEGSGEG